MTTALIFAPKGRKFSGKSRGSMLCTQNWGEGPRTICLRQRSDFVSPSNSFTSS